MRTWPTNIVVLETYEASVRFEYKKVSVDGEILFLKIAKSAKEGRNFENELAWGEFMNQLVTVHPELRIRATDPFSYQPNLAYLSEFIDAPFLCTKENVDDLMPYIPRYNTCLQAVDSIGLGYTTSLPTRDGKVNHLNLDIRWEDWFKASGGFGKYENDIERARALVKASTTLQSCMQHGDFVPWHIFNVSDEWVVYDSEHAHHDWPRFYDLAYSYSRLFVWQRKRHVAQALLNEYIATMQLPEPEFWEQFLPVLTSRAVGVLSDALTDLPKVNYVSTAEMLLQRCLDDPEMLRR